MHSIPRRIVARETAQAITVPSITGELTTMHFRTRAFLLTFVPIACLLGVSFLMVQGFVKHTVRAGLLNTLRQNERQVSQLRDENHRQNARLLGALSHDEDLKSAVRTFRSQSTGQPLGSSNKPTDDAPPTLKALVAASNGQLGDSVSEDKPLTGTLQEQLLRFGIKSGVDFIMVAAPDGTPMAGAVRAGGDSAELVPLFAFPQPANGDLMIFRGEPFQTGIASIESHGVKLASLILGERLHLSSFATSTVLLHQDWIMQSDIDKSRLPEIGKKLRPCSKTHSECALDLGGVEWLSMAILDNASGSDFRLYSLVNVDDSLRPVDTALRHIFLSVLLISVLIALLCSMAWSRAIVRPIADMVSRLHAAARTGKLPEFTFSASGIREIRDLEEGFNNATASVHKAHGELNEANLQFVQSLANALDARDRYTAGHSKRVSDISCAIASTMGQAEEDVERLRTGALLHDIGKIGIPDAVLQNPGKLSNEEFDIIKTHPLIGRRILEGVQGFAMYLPAVELHHENWDGTGYPRHMPGSETPLDARIIHVADAYDAMTTDRAYRKSMSHERAMQILSENAGTQFDPEVVATLFQVVQFMKFERHADTAEMSEMAAAAVRAAGPVPITVRTKNQPVIPVKLVEGQVAPMRAAS